MSRGSVVALLRYLWTMAQSAEREHAQAVREAKEAAREAREAADAARVAADQLRAAQRGREMAP